MEKTLENEMEKAITALVQAFSILVTMRKYRPYPGCGLNVFLHDHDQVEVLHRDALGAFSGTFWGV